MFVIFNPNPLYFMRDPSQRYSFSTEIYRTASGVAFTLTENNTYDKVTQINHIKWYYKIEGRKQELVKDLTMRMYFPEELVALLDYNDFQIVKRFGDLIEHPFQSSSVMQVIVARVKRATH